ncbi:hypothetical protein SDC9_154379 [bioreactor metagenome]|uniref:Uncharacterized protein n=1 Tax=bioreactor metagenome TaxID=1076179 RepID=A0A645F383_9ZZZZ
MTSGSPGSAPRDNAGKLSVTKLTHNKCIGLNGVAHPNSIAKNNATISPILQESKNTIDFFILLNIFLPSLIAATIVEKLSSVSTISAAPFATSVPVIPIATPMSAILSDGASLTPSPVIETIFPLDLNALTILTLCSGDTLANTLKSLTLRASSSSLILSSSAPNIA